MPCYFFSGSQYIRVSRGNTGAGALDPGYPKPISNWNWPNGFGAGGIDAALHSGTECYFFSGAQYIRVTRGNTGAGTVDAGYPKPISNWGWPNGFGANGIDAALYSGPKCYFFSGAQYIRVTRGDTGAGSVDAGYPKPISDWNWPNNFGARGIDGALYSGLKCYFFSGNQYIRVTRCFTGAGTVDPGYPKSISNWNWPAGFAGSGLAHGDALFSGFDDAVPSSRIKNVVVLMMENHSFDNMLGWVPGIGDLQPGLTSMQSTSPQPAQPPPAKQPCPIGNSAPFSTGALLPHQLVNVSAQIFGYDYGTSGPPANATPDMSGFVYESGGDTTTMDCFGPGELPVITKLAQTFTACTRWFCSVPGPTAPNRIYANCASSGGYAGGQYNVGTFPPGMATLTSIFGVLAAAGYHWGVYHEDSDFAVELLLNDVNAHPEWQYLDPGFTTFYSQIQAGTLPSYSFLTPDLWTNSQHPSADVRNGECVIANIYEAIANSKYWDQTLFIVVYDEHGGFWDSVPTPTKGVLNPDCQNWSSSSAGWSDQANPATAPFAFDRLGPRVPAILISPYTPAATNATQYDHSSIVATVLEIFGLSWPVPNQRIATANTFGAVVGGALRSGLPTTLTRPAAGGSYSPLPPLI